MARSRSQSQSQSQSLSLNWSHSQWNSQKHSRAVARAITISIARVISNAITKAITGVRVLPGDLTGAVIRAKTGAGVGASDRAKLLGRDNTHASHGVTICTNGLALKWRAVTLCQDSMVIILFLWRIFLVWFFVVLAVVFWELFRIFLCW